MNRIVATKSNLISAKSSLALSKQGYELLDKKRNILVRELMQRMGEAENIQSQINDVFTLAYSSLQEANVDMGILKVRNVSVAVPKEDSVNVKFRSIMGTEIPVVTYEKAVGKPPYGLNGTSTSLDDAYYKFSQVKYLTLELASIENSIYRLAVSIKKTQKRANALKNISIPRYEKMVRFIQNALEEKEREEFTRLKMIKRG